MPADADGADGEGKAQELELAPVLTPGPGPERWTGDWAADTLGPAQTVLVHRLVGDGGGWRTRWGEVAVADAPFAHGALRACWRATVSWAVGEPYVVKQYMSPDADVPANYVADVQMQTRARALADAYNAARPPLHVELLEAIVLELLPEASARFVAGNYVKHSNNGGVVGHVGAAGGVVRNTPQAFSHFTYAVTQGEAVVVDIQGVGDVYTDPQIHTRSAEQTLGDRGVRGMALFFATHLCSPVCAKLGLRPFQLSPAEIEALAATRVAGTTVPATPVAGDGRERWPALDAQAKFVGAFAAAVATDMAWIAALPDVFDAPASSEVRRDADLHYALAQHFVRDRSRALFHLVVAAQGGCEEAQQAVVAIKVQFHRPDAGQSGGGALWLVAVAAAVAAFAAGWLVAGRRRG
ncbi:uncharacterized protein AMSG_01336 [Thecamonas trahens ATCC 50062]|uniref:Alpha-type protein kinase domain-containing protein n=1 Tax=Thecamonas trahens ATCC 50062 TaxID=461836 RepID=A0A0L0DMU6_THETB|nr:hypothetical protein AMSG_01336 [Thecamonas trahens ATCC 50062]KNC53627.1 hypothetical protein AMSG_01336 [Thecamonas trahens ATCC 50062]|eukprot:XP_013761944.1 hypothetical protein AMSG_01336 [Thecamonas trahens ATCC 50062]